MINDNDFRYCISGLQKIIYNLLGNILHKRNHFFFFRDKRKILKGHNLTYFGNMCIWCMKITINLN